MPRIGAPSLSSRFF